MNIIYQLMMKLYGLAVSIVSNFNPKAKLWVLGRENWIEKMRNSISKEDKVIWVHCSSLGEFEQGRPVMEKLKIQYPNHKLAVSFFSPSGFEVRKNYSGADYIFYLPLDTASNAKKIVQVLHPEILILVKYEYWYNLLNQLEKQKIPVIVISAVIKENSLFLKSWANWFRETIKGIDYFFVQDEESKNRLSSIGIKQIEVSGDTRFDRVKEILNSKPQLDFVEKFKGNAKLIVVGSSWPDDELILAEYINQNLPQDWKVIFAPHNMDEKQLQNLQSNLKKKSIRFTKIENDNWNEFQVLIVDTVGLLTKIYAYSDLSYVGGGFTKTGVHNTLEPAVFGVPLIFGPNYQNYFEAIDLVNSTAAISFIDKKDCFEKLDELIKNETIRKQSGKAGFDYIQSKPNSTQLIMNWLKEQVQ